MLWRFGIKNIDHIIVYDNSDIYSSCRLWFSLKYFGHEKVSVLDGGFQKWIKEKKPTTKKAGLVIIESNDNQLSIHHNYVVYNGLFYAPASTDQNISTIRSERFRIAEAYRQDWPTRPQTMQ